MKHFTAGCRWLSLSVVLGSFCLSCIIVKEDRRDCPCTLAVEMRSLPVYPVLLYADGRPAGKALRDTCLSVMVPRGPRAVLAAVAGVSPGVPDIPAGSVPGASVGVASGMSALEVRIPYGSESPPLYAWSAVADCSGDTGSVTVRLFRHFCNLVLDVVSPPGWAKPFQAAVRGEVDGWSLTSSAPTAGPFRCMLSSGYTCRLPRQRPGSELWLDIVMPEGVVRTFPLGAVLLRSGYDWTAADLPDIGLRLDLSVTQITLSYGVFSEVFPLEIVI